jgi:uncharacterized membrane protein (UPF0127 family)
MTIFNITKDTRIADDAKQADTFLWRARGMIFRRFDDFDGLVFDRCSSIHMMFMLIPLDIIFVDHENRICGLRKNLKPWRMAMQRGARMTIELPAGVIEASRCEVGDDLRIERGPV